MEIANVTSLRCGPVQRQVTFKMNARAQIAGLRALRTNGGGDVSDFLVGSANHQNTALLLSPVCLRQCFDLRLLNCLCPVPPGNFANRANLFESVETALWIAAQLLNG